LAWISVGAQGAYAPTEIQANDWNGDKPDFWEKAG
jgi:hypothetical protein